MKTNAKLGRFIAQRHKAALERLKVKSAPPRTKKERKTWTLTSVSNEPKQSA